jgi:hypothetical protein
MATAKDPAKGTVTADRPEPGPGDALKAHVEAKLEDARGKVEIELAEAQFNPPFDWEVVAWGPWQLPFDPAINPGRIIFVGEQAAVATAVILNPAMAQNVAGFGAKIELNYWTSNTQTMQPVPGISTSRCIDIYANQYFYIDVFVFTPYDEACLFEMNICARVCNCNRRTVPGYAAFVRHVFDFDPEDLGLITGAGLPTPPTPSPWAFDRPIRFMVAQPDEDCC